MNVFEKKIYQSEILKDLSATCEAKIKEIGYCYEVVGEEQAKSWRTGELLWEDEEKTIPKMENKYDYVQKKTLDKEDKEKTEVINSIIAYLEKFLEKSI